MSALRPTFLGGSILLVASLLCSAAGAQVHAVAPPVTDQASGQLHLVVFIAGGPADHSQIRIEASGHPTLFPNSDGAAHVRLEEGTGCIQLGIPPALGGHGQGYIVHRICNIQVLDSESTEVLVTLNESALEVLSVDRTTPGEVSATRRAAEAFKEKQSQGPPGTLAGVIVASDTKQPIAAARVFVRGLPVEATSDANGHFSLVLPVGNYRISVIHPQFATYSQDDLVITENEERIVRLELSPSSAELDDYVVTAPYIEGGVAGLLSQRRQSSSVTDALGSEELAKSPDGSASSATRRIVGASIVGGQFLFVRGLGGRYSNVRLNSVPLPSTDPDLPGFQLDLFPSSLLSSLTIAKTFSPNIPASFTGGSLNIETRGFPEKFSVSGSASLSYNSETSFTAQPSHSSGSLDLLGTDDGGRALPNGFPTRAVTNANFDRSENTAIASALGDEWEPSRQTALPNLSLGLTLGNTLKLAGESKFSFLATIGYRRGYSHYFEEVTNASLQTIDGEQQLAERETFDREVGTSKTQIGALASLSYAWDDDNSLTTVTLLTQNGESQTNQVRGFSENENAQTADDTLRFVERRLLFNQLLGQHESVTDWLNVRWQLNTANTFRGQPDTRRTLYADRPYGFAFVSRSGSGERLFTELNQTDVGGGLDLDFLLADNVIFKAGYLGRRARRSFSARRLRSEVLSNEIEPLLLPPNELFSRDQAGEQWTLTEVTSPTDGFAAEEDLHSVYGMLESPLFGALRGMGGVRMEAYRQAIEVAPPIEVSGDAVIKGGDHSNTDLMWASSLIAEVTDSMNLRAAYGGTVARPLVRELAPFLSQDFTRRRTVQGNPELKRTFVHNFDLRWEYFLNPTEILALSLFYKVFNDPIESVIVSQNGDIGYANIEGAENFGIELEARIDLHHLSPTLESFNFGGNLAVVDSQVSLYSDQAANATSQKRPLAGQSPYVLNLSLGYEPEESPISLFAFYNVFGRRIQDVGRQGLPDIYEEPFHSVDFTGFYQLSDNLKISASVSNLLHQQQSVTQGVLNFRRSQRGSGGSLKLSWSPN